MQPETLSEEHPVAARVTVCAAGADDLDAVNRVVQQAVDAWRLPERVRRLAGPSLGYRRSDLAHMELVLARERDGTTCAVAAWEAAHASPGEDVLLLHGLYVVPSAQRCGIGTRLLAAALAAAASRGLCAVEVRAWREAEAFFVARGFAAADLNEASGAYPRRMRKRVA